MRRVFIVILVLLSISIYGQDGIKFTIEELSKPEKILYKNAYHEIYEKLILSDVEFSKYEIEKDSINFPFGIVAKSEAPDSLVNYGYHSFFNGMYQAYADHRPFVLSPDMIWLLISQGFARHISSNPEELRNHFVDFKGKLSLVVSSKEIALDNPDSPWENVFPEFTEKIGKYVGIELIDILSSDFTTTTPVEKIASEITIMEAVEPYFEFIVIYMICGIPEITLKGTTEDWEKVLEKAQKLKKYELDWWISELEPILKEFINASNGNVNKKFWRNMFKAHSQKKYGAPDIIDGWIVKFFPYDKDGKRNNLKELKGSDNLPEEIVKVNLKYLLKTDNGSVIETPLELWSGFVGLAEDESTFTLTPQIGWMIRKRDINRIGVKQKLESQNNTEFPIFGGIMIRVEEVPEEIFEFEKINTLELQFIKEIKIPDRLSEIEIEKLVLTGEINKEEIERISKLFPDTELIINRETINAR